MARVLRGSVMVDRVGQQLGNYRLIRLLGEGGFAEVYLGEHIHLNTQAAIKVLQTRLASNEVEKFRNEARTIARLRHPHIVRVLEFGVEEGVPFLVMEYAPHGSLRQRHLKGVPVLLAIILPYVRQIAGALQYVHDQKLIHRDIKPENLLLGPNNEVLLSDFGIAIVSQGSTSLEGHQSFGGTVAYTAPEQLQDRPRPASDQYSLGVVVYEWLCGERPFEGNFTEIATKQILTPPPPLRERMPAISPLVEEVVMKALAKELKLRFASVQDFANALEQAAQMEQQSTLITTPALPGGIEAPAPEALATQPAGDMPGSTPADLSTRDSGDQETAKTRPSSSPPAFSVVDTKTLLPPPASPPPQLSRRKVLV